MHVCACQCSVLLLLRLLLLLLLLLLRRGIVARCVLGSKGHKLYSGQRFQLVLPSFCCCHSPALQPMHVICQMLVEQQVNFIDLISQLLLAVRFVLLLLLLLLFCSLANAADAC